MSARNNNTRNPPPSKKQIPLHLLSAPSRAYNAPKRGEQSLLDPKTQEQYRELIQGKIEAFSSRYPFTCDGVPNNAASPEAKESGSNILLLFRKLREGIVASSRVDDFAIEVYETSACWSVLLNDTAQSTSILSHLPELYRKHPPPRPSSSTDHTPTRAQVVASLHALHLLRLHHPSQSEFRAHLSSSSSSSDMVPAAYRTHVGSVAASLRRNAYSRLARLTDPASHPLLQNLPSDQVHFQALLVAYARIRDVARPQVWKCLCAAYRDVSGKEEAEAWLGRSLLLRLGPEALAEWMDSKVKAGEAAPKPPIGTDGGRGGWSFVRQVPRKS